MFAELYTKYALEIARMPELPREDVLRKMLAGCGMDGELERYLKVMEKQGKKGSCEIM